MESLKERLNEDMKAAMKAREAGKDRLAVIRMVRSAIRQTEIDGKTTLDDDGVMAVIGKELKQRRDSLAEFQKGVLPLFQKTTGDIEDAGADE